MRCPSNGEGRKKEKEGNLLSSSSSFFEFVTCDNWEKEEKKVFCPRASLRKLRRKERKKRRLVSVKVKKPSSSFRSACLRKRRKRGKEIK